MRINIAVCDDEDESLHMIQKELYHAADKLNIEIETYFYNKGKKVLDFIYNEKEDFDILFLDIDMPDISGLEVAKKLRQKNSDIILIFISAHEQYVFESIEYFVFTFLITAFSLKSDFSSSKRNNTLEGLMFSVSETSLALTDSCAESMKKMFSLF